MADAAFVQITGPFLHSLDPKTPLRLDLDSDLVLLINFGILIKFYRFYKYFYSNSQVNFDTQQMPYSLS